MPKITAFEASKQLDLDFPEKGIPINGETANKPKKHDASFGLDEDEPYCPQCELGGGACPKHPSK